MSILTMAMEDCCIMNFSRVDDGLGGYTAGWTEGATFKAAIGKNNSPEQLVAEKEGLTEAFTVVVDRTFTVDYHDVFKRKSDGSIFRATSRTKDSTAHKASTVKIATFTAERWELPA